MFRGPRPLLVVLLIAACGGGSPSGPPTSNPTAAATATAAPATAAPTVAATAAPVATTTITAQGWIVYQGAPLGLSIIRPDGSGNHVILGPPGDQVHPDWSPDGTMIAYVQATNSAQAIWITDVDGKNPAPLFDEVPAGLEGLFLDNPAWSPDGKQLAMVGYEGSPQLTLPASSSLVIVDVASGEVTIAGKLLSAEGSLHSFPRWSPDAKSMVMVLDQFTGDQYVGGRVAITRASQGAWSEPEPITNVFDAPRSDWHPIDDLIVYCTHDIGGLESTDDPANLFTIHSDGSGVTPVTTFAGGGARAAQPSWTADGQIIFDLITGSNDERGSIAFINADGSGQAVAVGTSFIGTGNRPHPRFWSSR